MLPSGTPEATGSSETPVGNRMRFAADDVAGVDAVSVVGELETWRQLVPNSKVPMTSHRVAWQSVVLKDGARWFEAEGYFGEPSPNETSGASARQTSWVGRAQSRSK
jgi:hypothetical protein